MKVYAIALNTFREAIRNKVLYSVVLFAIIVVAVSAFFGMVTIGDQAKVIADFGFFALSFFGAIITIVSGISLLHKELKQKTVYNILSKPVSRWQFIVGKYLGLTLTVSLLISLMGIALIAFLSLFGTGISVALFQGVLFCIFEVFVVAAVTIFFSSMVVTITLPAILTLATYVTGRSISYLSFFLNDGDQDSSALKVIIAVLDNIIPDLSLFNVANQIVYNQPITAIYTLQAFAYAVCYSLVLLFFSVLIFARREML